MRTAVVVDDEPIIRLDLCDMLESGGFKVVGKASDGFDAVDICARLKPDIVLMDIKMPLFDGFAAARKIIEGSLAGCVVMVTAFFDKELIESAMEVGVSGYIVKPVEEKNLIPTIEIAFSQSRRLSDSIRTAQDAENKLLEKNLIDRAKMMIAQKDEISEGEAYSQLRKFAMDRRLTLGEAAKAVIDMNSENSIINAKRMLTKKYDISEEVAFKRIRQLSIDKKIDISLAAREIIKQLGET